MKDADYYAENTGEFEELTDTQKEAVFNGDVIELGDTSKVSEEQAEMEAASETNDKEEVSETPSTESENEKEPEPKLLAKDGEHTIPYSELVEAREKAEQFAAFSNQQAKLIEELQTAKTQDAETGGTEAQDAVIDEYEGDYPEIAEELKPLIQEMIDEGVKKGLEAVEQQINEKVAPIQESAQEAANKARNDAVIATHPDAFEVYSSKELQEWINSQPSFVRDRYQEVLLHSTADEMNEMFSAFKKDAHNFGEEKPKAESESITDKAKDIIAKTEKKVPASLSDVPASQAGTLDESEAILDMSPPQLEQKFSGKSLEQIREIMSKSV